ncbi:3-keto-disaccharide hydrolase [Galbibacter sp. BG1]
MKTINYLFIASLAMMSCKQQNNDKTASEESIKTETEATQELASNNDGWKILFDGTNFDSWHMFNGGEVNDSWTIKDDAMVLTPSENAGNIVTNEEFKNFELSLEWKISEGGNSGFFWGIIEDKKYHEPYQTGPEIQIIDNEKHPDAKNGESHQAGALYDMIAPSEKVARPAGGWNTCILVINHKTNQGSVTLNGTEIVKFPVHGDKWEEMIANSKFKGWDGFGASETGKIGLQYHGDEVSFRNIKIKELN